MSELNVYIPTCDANIFVVKYFQYFFNKYWGKHMKVKILGFNPPDFELDENFEFISMGSEQVGGAKGWTNHLLDFFEKIEDEYFVFGLDDFMISRPVDLELFKTCKELLSDKIGRIDLQPSLQYARRKDQVNFYAEKNGVQFLSLRSPQPGGSDYHIASAFSIWNKKWFLKNMKRNWSPWDWELTGSSSLQGGDSEPKVIGSVDRWTIKKLEVLSSRWGDLINIRGIRKEDVEEMKKLSKPTDRIKNFIPIMDNQWYYSVPNGDWESTIFGD
jgi:hypothetical protein